MGPFQAPYWCSMPKALSESVGLTGDTVIEVEVDVVGGVMLGCSRNSTASCELLAINGWYA